MRDIKVVNLRDGAILLYKKYKMKCTGVSPAFVFGANRDKYPEPTAHFCEHMLFQGTKSLTKEEFGKMQMEILPYLNAFTSISYLSLYLFRSNQLLDKCLKFGSDMLLNPAMEEQYIQSEKGVIKQELVRKKASSQAKFDCAFLRTIRNHHNTSSMVLGSEDEIDKMDAQTLKNFHNDIAIRQNFVCAVASGLPLFKIKKLINKYFIDNMNSNPNYPVDKSTELKYNFEKPGNMNIESCKSDKTTVRITVKLENCDEKDELVAGLFANMLSSATVGDYYYKLRSKGLVYEALAFSSSCNYYHGFGFNFMCVDENVNKIIDVIGECLKLRRKELYDRDFITAIQNNDNYIKDEASVKKSQLSKDLLFQYLRFGTKFFKKKDRNRRKKIYKAISSEDIRAFVQKHFSKPENIYVTMITNNVKYDFYSYQQIQKILLGE